MALTLAGLVLVLFLTVAFTVDGEFVEAGLGVLVIAALLPSARAEYHEQRSVPRKSLVVAAVTASLMVVGAILYGADLEFGALLATAGLVAALVALFAGRKGWATGDEDLSQPS
jgi:hypothetical protein